MRETGTSPPAAARRPPAPREGAARSAAQRRTPATVPPAAVVPAREQRSPARITMLIVGGVIVGVAVLVFALTSLGGGSSGGHGSSGALTKSTGATTRKTHTTRASSTTHGETSAPAASPAETHVVVLNGTSTPELAHKLSANLQQSGYSQSQPLAGTPPGSHSATVVEYASGHRADATHVAQALEVTRISPMEGAVSSLAGSATVVVIAGLDKATPAVSGGGEAAAPTGATP
jgi:hypothetical protein